MCSIILFAYGPSCRSKSNHSRKILQQHHMITRDFYRGVICDVGTNHLIFTILIAPYDATAKPSSTMTKLLCMTRYSSPVYVYMSGGCQKSIRDEQ
jgi:hypothetical protein